MSEQHNETVEYIFSGVAPIYVNDIIGGIVQAFFSAISVLPVEVKDEFKKLVDHLNSNKKTGGRACDDEAGQQMLKIMLMSAPAVSRMKGCLPDKIKGALNDAYRESEI